ncbi:MAG: efflux RND transporter periplasmic adaptor subunit [Myxococcota bacterium]
MTPRTGLLALAILSVAACGGGDAAAPPPATPVVVTPVEVRRLDEHIEATGQLLARDQARVAAEVPGRITEVLHDEGDRVEAGAVVIRIDPERRELERDDALARVAEAEASLGDREREAKRYRTLRRKQVASESQLDQVETELQLARARLQAARAHLGVAERAVRDANLRAPFGGLISRRSISVGEFVQAGQSLFELVALDPIQVEFHLAEKDSARVAVGVEVTVRVAPYPDEEFRARIVVVSPTIDPRTRTLRLKGELPNPEGRLRPGLFARVGLGVDRRDHVLMVPEEAVLYRADGAIVFRVVGTNVVERRVIQPGVHRDGWIEVSKGLAAGDRVVRRGHTELIDGAHVVAHNPDGTPVRPHVAEGRRSTGEGTE